MGKKQKCMIIGAVPIKSADIFKKYNPDDFFVICADGGYDSAVKYRIKPDLVVGDFDSVTGTIKTDIETVKIPKEKDITDTMFAVLSGMKLGYSDFTILGCIGGDRLDHSMANIETLYFIMERGGTAFLEDNETTVLLLKNNKLRLTDMMGAIVSVFPYSCSSCTVSYRGVEYPLNREKLVCGRPPMGVSNRITGKSSEISIHEGTAMIVLHDKKG